MRPVTNVELLILPVVMGVAAWQLWRARTRGEFAARGNVIRYADSPGLFLTGVIIYSAVLAGFAAVAVLMAYRALVPLPLAQRMAGYYPSAAVAKKVEGHATLRCRVTPAYGVKDCQVTSETPPSYGFGAAAIQVATLMTLPPADRGTIRPGQFINLPIRFKLPAESASGSRFPRRAHTPP
ncbi:TonB family protein [Phenylobacterium sp.]|jgi:TonB family protein|uniref:TonB family protein n=1 Tax=Phenylobacterium sp. TaxID=1871053 RepID=UPI002E343E42|nr:TonB family protein [Phenylobacterium sp.]HEX3364428.1 TonB family protein [Phenylobacterium sp.]